MNELISINELIKDERIRKVEYEGRSYFSVIDVFSVLLNADRKQAQNYYHVFKKRLRDYHLDLSFIEQFKAQAFDRKFYLTEFTTFEGIEFFTLRVTSILTRKNSESKNANRMK